MTTAYARAADLLDGGTTTPDTRRNRFTTDHPLALDVEQRFDHTAVRTPALERIAEQLRNTVDTRAGRLVVSIPPQEGKTELLRALCFWLLTRNPATRIVYASYALARARKSGRAVRDHIRTHGADLGLRLNRGSWDAADWTLDGHRGGMLCVGVGGALTGAPADVLIVDDPIRGQKEADSDTIRDALHTWWSTVARTRLSSGATVIVVQCMTGDTPVLMGDGTEKPLRDVRPGDTVATYEGGALTTSTVRNWVNQGPDSISTIKMKSGRAVRANARHPFLTIENGERVWRRTDQLAPGSVIQTATGEDGEASPAPSTSATDPSPARGSAPRTTTSNDGPTGVAAARPTSSGPPTSSIGTGSPPTSTTPCSPSRTAGAPSAASTRLHGTPAPTGTGSSALTTITAPARSGGCSATTATSPLVTASPPTSSAPPLTTWKLAPDEVVEVIPCGVEDVFDLQIDRTENFIANGLVSHNTRWHPDDLAGRRIAEGWPAINIPALADGHAPDALDRPAGEWLLSAQGRTDADWQDTRDEVGERAFAALYQGEPAPAEGGIFQRDWFNRHRLVVQPDGCLPPTVYVDPADNTGDGDEAGIIVATRHPPTQRALLLADLSAPMTVARWARLALLTCVRWTAPTLAWEKSLSQLGQRITDAWELLHLHATAVRACDGDRDRALARLTRPHDTPDAVAVLARQLAELDDDDIAGVLRFGPVGPARRPITARGSKDLRMQLAAPLFETGRAAIVGALPLFEHQAATWQVGQSSPDRVDTGVHAVLDLASAGGPATVRRPGRTAQRIPTRTPARTVSAAGRVTR